MSAKNIAGMASVLALLAAPLCVAQVRVQQCTRPPDNMVGWWPGDGTANDITGNGHNGTFNGTYAAGEVGQAFILEGTDDSVKVPNDTSLNPKLITVDAWVYVATNDLTAQFYPSIIGKGNVGGAYEDESYALYLTPLGTVDFLVNVDGTPAGRFTAHGSALNGDAWNFVAGTYDGTTVNVYVNGTLGVPAVKVGTINPSPENDLLIGKADRTTPIASGLQDSFLKGRIDEAELFDRALLKLELDKIYGAGTAGKCKCQEKPVEGKGDVKDDDGHMTKMNVQAERDCDDLGHTHVEDDSGKVMDGDVKSMAISGDTAVINGPGTLSDGTRVSYTAVLVGNQPLIGANLFSISWITATGSVFQRSGALIDGYIVVPQQ